MANTKFKITYMVHIILLPESTDLIHIKGRSWILLNLTAWCLASPDRWFNIFGFHKIDLISYSSFLFPKFIHHNTYHNVTECASLGKGKYRFIIQTNKFWFGLDPGVHFCNFIIKFQFLGQYWSFWLFFAFF